MVVLLSFTVSLVRCGC